MLGYTESNVTHKLEKLSASVLNGHFIFNKSYDDLNLQKQFEKASPLSHNVSYQMTEDRNLKQQYIKIRQQVYQEAYNDPNVGEDFTDHISNIFVATAGAGNVIGGIRLTVSTPDSPKILPIESCGVNLRELFPKIDFSKVIIGEAGRSAVLPEFRDGEVCNRLQTISKEYFIKEMGAEIGFGSCDAPNMRRLKIFFKRMGYNFIGRTDIPVYVKHSAAELYLWAIDFTPDQKYRELLEPPAVENATVAEVQHEIA